MKEDGRDPKADWAGTYAEDTPLAFRFDGAAATGTGRARDVSWRGVLPR